MKCARMFLLSLLTLTCVSVDAARTDDVVTFAIIADSHVTWSGGKATSVLKEIVADINSRSVDFVIHAGDEANMGRLDQLEPCRDAMNELRAPYYTIPGNHDGCWSESGGTDFSRVFGSDHFCFMYKGWRFVGVPCGPQAHIVKPATIPKEAMQWVQSLKSDPHSIFFLHCPIGPEVSNSIEFKKLIRSKGATILIGGHTHVDRALSYNDGFPGFVCRNTESSKAHPGIGYTIVRIGNNILTACEVCKGASGFEEKTPWYTIELKPEESVIPVDESSLPTATCDRYTILEPSGDQIWHCQDNADIISGFAVDDSHANAFFNNTAGELKCIDLTDGSVKWVYKMGSKSLSTPAYSEGIVVTGCTNGNIVAVDAATGKKRWSVKTDRALIASALIKDGVVYMGSSDGRFRALDLYKGRLLWACDEGVGPVQTAMTLEGGTLIVNDWNATVWAIDTANGKSLWKWKEEKRSLMLSAGGSKPVVVGGYVFFGTPDQHLHALNASTGAELWTLPDIRESIGLSEDGKTLFAKSQTGKLYAITIGEDSPKWSVDIYQGTDTCRSPIVCHGGVIYVPSYNGSLYCYNEADGAELSSHKLSIAPVNPISIIPGVGVLCSTMDGYLSLVKCPF